MKTPAASILTVFAMLFLSSCASSYDIKQRKHDTQEFESVRSQLKPGLDLAAIQKLAPKMGNCTGSPQGVQQCEAQYLTSVARSEPTLSVPGGSAPTAHYSKITFDFLKGKLVRWTEMEELKPSSW